MPIYQYEGQHFDLPDGLSNEEAIGKIKKHLGKNDRLEMTPTENPLVGGLEAAGSMVAGIPSQIAGGLAGLGDLLTGKGIDAAGDKVRKVQEDNFGFGAYKPSTKTGQYYADNLGKLFAAPGEFAGDVGGKIGAALGNEALGRLSGQLPVDAAMNFLPIGGIAAGAGKMMRPKIPEPVRPVPELAAPKPTETLPTQGEMFPTADVAGPNVHNTPQQIAELRGAEAGQPDLFGNRNINPADLGPELGPKPVPEPMDNMAQHELFDQPEQFRTANPYEAVTGDWRVDENGMPVKADLSMDAANAENPLQRNLWGDELPQKHPQEALPLTEAMDSMEPAKRSQAINRELVGEVQSDNALEAATYRASPFRVPKNQRGSAPILNDLAKKLIEKFNGGVESQSVKNGPLQPPVPKPNSMATPTDPATITAKNTIREKVGAVESLRKLAPEYSNITTPQEAVQLAAGQPDIGHVPVVDNFRNATISGMNGMVYLKPNVPEFNFIRHTRQEWANTASKFSKNFVTGKEGFANLGSKLSKADRVQAMQVLHKHAVAGIEITPERVSELGLKPEQNAFILSARKAMQELDGMRNDSMLSSGRAPAPSLPGYLPSIFDGSYKAVIHSKDGKVIAVPQSDTALGRKNAINAILKDNPEAKVTNLSRQGLSTNARSNPMFDGTNDILNVLAKHDESFAKAQRAAQMHVAEAAFKNKGMDVHELHKSGVEGAVGERRHLSPERNAEDLFKALVQYSEQAAEYYPMQKGLNEIGQMLNDPKLSDRPNVKAVATQYLDHVTGQGLNPLGAGLNWAIDALPKAVGVSAKIPLTGLRGVKTAMGIHMMGILNPTFTALQFSQLLTGAMPEFAKVGSKLNLDATTSAVVGPATFTALRIADKFGKEQPNVAQHMKDAYQYAKDAGIMDFSELENARGATRNKGIVMAEKAGAFNIALAEAWTRPPVFMTFADMFHRFGLSDKEAFAAAHHATNMSMGDYNLAERPQIYSQLGVLGEFGGALTTFKHNALTNLYIRGRDVIAPDANGKRMYKAAAAALAGTALLQGITGLPGYEELDLIYQGITNNSIRETALQQFPEWSKSGVLSATSGLDFQSRASMNRIVPEIKAGSLSPQLALLGDMIAKTATYAKYPSQESLNEFIKVMTPASLKGFTDNVDPDGTVRNSQGQKTSSTPRTATEQTIRKTLAVRPLRESIESKDVYVDAKALKDKEDAQKEITKRFRNALVLGDEKGMNTLAQMYYDKEGDPQTLYNSQAIQEALIRANKDQRERMTGKLSGSIRSINRYRDMHDGS